MHIRLTGLRSMLVLLLFWFSCSAALAAGANTQPDILLLMPDQMRGDCLSIVGHPVLRTPNMDRLAKQGTLFRRAYSTVPSCIPARFALLTGLSPQTSGVIGYFAKPITTPTLPRLLAENGYSTILVGRNMHQAPASDCGYQQQMLGSTYVSDDDYDAFLKAAAPESGGIRRVINRLGLDSNRWPAKPWDLPDNLHPTTWIIKKSEQVLAESTPDKPLFLTASFYAPHPPLFPPKNYFEKYYHMRLPAPAHGTWVDWQTLSPEGDNTGHRVLLQGETLRAAQAGYFGLIEQLDTEFASLIAALKARSERARRPWIILLTSDHGEMLGDHGYFRKCEPYEGSANIPFIVTGSADLKFKPGQRSLRPVCLEDIMPTLLELAGAQSPPAMDGVSLLPLLRGQKAEIRPWLHFEHTPCYSQEQAFQALTDGHFKYIWRPHDGSEQLFNLSKDPHEERNLVGSRSARTELEQWRHRLIQRLAQRPNSFSDGQRLTPKLTNARGAPRP